MTTGRNHSSVLNLCSILSLVSFIASLQCVDSFSTRQIQSVQLNCQHDGRIPATLSPLESYTNAKHKSFRLYSSTADKRETKKSKPTKKNKTEKKKFQFFLDIYVGYVTKLWRETNTTQRRLMANQKAYHAIRQVQHLLRDGEEYVNIIDDTSEDDTMDDMEKRAEAKINLLHACDTMLDILGPIDQDNSVISHSHDTKDNISVVQNGMHKMDVEIPNGKHANLDHVTKSLEEDSQITQKAIELVSDEKVAPKKKKKGSRSVLFGAAMGAAATGWVFSGNFIFTSVFTLATILAQLEYYRMAMRVGIYPARKISVVGACSMYVTALFAPALHQITLPIFATYAMIWFLTMRRKVSTISEIATTFTGMFYLGYIPSFWVKLRMITSQPGEPATLIRPLVAPLLELVNNFAKSTFPHLCKFIHSPVTAGSVFIFWTWISIAFSDVGAYFMGRKYGKTKLGAILPAAGAASPNKTIEGFFGGTLFSAAFATTGAWIMQWPYWYLTGPVHGIMLGFLGLVGDLTASMLKRDSGLKDFGDLLPEHGGIMDRVDSFVFTAPYSWLVCQFIIPALRARARLAF